MGLMKQTKETRELKAICEGIKQIPGGSTSFLPNKGDRKMLSKVLMGMDNISITNNGTVLFDTGESISTHGNTTKALVLFRRIDGVHVFSAHHFFTMGVNREGIVKHGNWAFIGVDGVPVHVEYPERGKGMKDGDAGVFPVVSTRAGAVPADKYHVDQAKFEGHPLNGEWKWIPA